MPTQPRLLPDADGEGVAPRALHRHRIERPVRLRDYLAERRVPVGVEDAGAAARVDTRVIEGVGEMPVELPTR